MSEPDLYPLLFEPVYKDYLWGGDRILSRYGRDMPPGIYAESWEVSAHDDGMSVVQNGPLAGQELAAVAQANGERLLGSRVAGRRFPLLMKLIDAQDRLSVQVHPDDASAVRLGGEPKTELWYLLEADPRAAVFAGLAPGVGEARFREALASKEVESLLCRVPVAAGEAVFLPGGRVHAIDRGCLIFEVQQSSNTTYRLHDWDRVGADGTPRELHIEQALSVIRWEDEDPVKPVRTPLLDGPPRGCELIYASPYFRMERWPLEGRCRVEAMPESFRVLFCAEGTASLGWNGGEINLEPGTSCLVPAELGGFELAPAGRVELLLVTVP
jgi:mannose-6-phosphate isomerase